MPDETLEILLVEDNADDAALFARTLKKADIPARLRVAKDGREALDFIFGTGLYSDRDLANQPKVVFLDLKMPKVNGLEVLRRIKADVRTRTIPIVAFSSSQEESDLIECYNLKVNSYIVKPIDFDAFGESVRLVCEYWLQLNQTPNPNYHD